MPLQGRGEWARRTRPTSCARLPLRSPLQASLIGCESRPAGSRRCRSPPLLFCVHGPALPPATFRPGTGRTCGWPACEMGDAPDARPLPLAPCNILPVPSGGYLVLRRKKAAAGTPASAAARPAWGAADEQRYAATVRLVRELLRMRWRQHTAALKRGADGRTIATPDTAMKAAVRPATPRQLPSRTSTSTGTCTSTSTSSGNGTAAGATAYGTTPPAKRQRSAGARPGALREVCCRCAALSAQRSSLVLARPAPRPAFILPAPHAHISPAPLCRLLMRPKPRAHRWRGSPTVALLQPAAACITPRRALTHTSRASLPVTRSPCHAHHSFLPSTLVFSQPGPQPAAIPSLPSCTFAASVHPSLFPLTLSPATTPVLPSLFGGTSIP